MKHFGGFLDPHEQVLVPLKLANEQALQFRVNLHVLLHILPPSFCSGVALEKIEKTGPVQLETITEHLVEHASLVNEATGVLQIECRTRRETDKVDPVGL